jgi:hypothetical protein
LLKAGKSGLRDSSFKRERPRGTAETRRGYWMLDADAGTVVPKISE